jgi:hypothetical protein
MAKAFLTSFSLHVAAVGLLVWLAPDGQSMPSEKPQLIELQPMALLPSPPPAPAVAAESVPSRPKSNRLRSFLRRSRHRPSRLPSFHRRPSRLCLNCRHSRNRPRK